MNSKNKPEGLFKVNGVTIIPGSGTEQFLPVKIGFCKLFFDSELIDTVASRKYLDRNIYFRDIYIFVNRVKDIIYSKTTNQFERTFNFIYESYPLNNIILNLRI